MASEPQGAGSQLAPLGARRRLVRQAPQGRPSRGAPPGEDHAENLCRLIDVQLRAAGRRSMWSGHALPSRVEFEAVKRTDQATVADLAANRRPQVRPQMWTDRVGDADATLVVAPGDDLLPHPGLLDQFLPQNRLAIRDEVPTLGERRQFSVRTQRTLIRLRDHGASVALWATRTDASGHQGRTLSQFLAFRPTIVTT